MATSKYNAESAWDYLGSNLFGGRGAYDYSSLPRYKQIFERIEQEPLRKQPSFDDSDVLSASVGRYNSARSMMNNLTNNQLMQQMLDGSLFNMANSMASYPQSVVSNALAGRYQSFI